MPYGERDGKGKIKGLYARPQEGIPKEYLPQDDAEVVAYRNPPPTAMNIKRAEDIAALGTRAELIQAINDLQGASAPMKAILRKLARVIYNREKGTID